VPLVSTPGGKYAYSNPGIAMLTYGVTASLKDSEYRDIRTYLKRRVFEHIGIDDREYTIGYGKTYEVDGLKLVPSWGGGEFTAKAIARIGLLMLHKGHWQDRQIIDSSIINQVIHYGNTALPNPLPTPHPLLQPVGTVILMGFGKEFPEMPLPVPAQATNC